MVDAVSVLAGSSATAEDEPRHLPPPVWALLVLPFGLAVGFATIAIPYVMRERGVDVPTIASVSAISSLPHFLKLFWAPALDSGPKRKHWYFAMVATTAATLAVTALVPPDPNAHLGPFSLLTIFTALLFVAQAAVATSSSAVLALVAVTVPLRKQGRTSGWQTVGNLFGTSVGGALVTYLIAHMAPITTAIVVATLCCVSAIPAFFIVEEPLPKRPLGKLLVDLLRDLWKTVKSYDGWTGLVICLSPVGTGALSELFSAVAKEYAADEQTRENMVVLVNGVMGGIMSAAGALLGGYVSDRIHRRVAYALFGGFTALAAIGMMLGPATPTTFTLGCLAYSFANGLCYAAFYAFVFEMVGKEAGVTTKLALFVGASNLAINYVKWLDGLGYGAGEKLWPGQAWGGRVGMLGMDALASFVGIALLSVMVVWVRRRKARDAVKGDAAPAQ